MEKRRREEEEEEEDLIVLETPAIDVDELHRQSIRKRFTKTLVEYARSGDLEKVEEKLREGSDVNMQAAGSGCTALHYAVYYNRVEVVERLLSTEGVNVGQVNVAGVTAVQWAVEQAHPELVRRLVRAGAELDVSCAYRAVANADLDMIELLIDLSGSGVALFNQAVQISQDRYEPILHAAVVEGNVAVVRLLIRKGLSPNTINDRRRTDIASEATMYAAIHRAVLSDRPAVLSALLELGADVEVRDHGLRTALHWACATMNVECTRILLKHPIVDLSDGDSAGMSPLDLVVRNERHPLWEPMLSLLHPFYRDDHFFELQDQQNRIHGELLPDEDQLSLDSILSRLVREINAKK